MPSAPSLFVSRDLPVASDLRRELTAAGYRVTGRSLLRFDAVPFTLPAPTTDWIFFYSSRCVQFFLAGLVGPLAPATRLATLGAGTAATLREKLREPDFVGSGRPLEVATAFAERVGRGSVLFPRARQSRLSVQSSLPPHITVVDLVVYDNAIAADRPVPATDIAILTSPLNARAYLAAAPRPVPPLIAIGRSTADFLLAQGQHAFVAERPDEATLAKLVLDLFPPHP